MGALHCSPRSALLPHDAGSSRLCRLLRQPISVANRRELATLLRILPDCNQPDENGYLPLCLAAGSYPNARLLLNARPDLRPDEVEPVTGQTAVQRAIQLRQPLVAYRLFDAGAVMPEADSPDDRRLQALLSQFGHRYIRPAHLPLH